MRRVFLGLASIGLLAVASGVLTWEALAWLASLAVVAQISIPNTFVAGTIIDPDQMNQNFDELGTKAFNRAGGTISGPVTIQSDVTVDPNVTVDGADISDYLDGAGNVTAAGDVTAAGTVTAADIVATDDITAAGDITATGAVTAGTVTVVGDVVLTTDASVRRNTVDGADVGHAALSGGGAGMDRARGGFLYVTGNENGAPGSIILAPGNIAGSQVRVMRASGTGADALTIVGATGLVILPLGQLQFPAVANPSADANTLDDFVKGNWTPILGGAGGQSGQSYHAQVGHYVKIGPLVSLQFQVQINLVGTISGALQIKGLPFVPHPSAPLAACALAWSSMPSTWVSLVATINPAGSGALDVMGASVGATSNLSGLVQANIGSGSQLRGMVQYRATT